MVTVIALLAAISIPIYGMVKHRVEDVTCTTHMKSVKVALDHYLQDNRKWPQPPEGLQEDEEKMWKWWIEEMEAYDVYQKQWLCPTHRGAINQRPKDEIPEYAGTYIPTQFDDHEFTPYKWRQPWLLERGDFHGRGAKYIMPDGSIDVLPASKAPAN